jgi:uncharacterized protein (DUF427 family)
MPKALWNGTLLAESNDCKTVEGNYYFPLDSLKKEYFTESQTTSICSWKGTANYYTITVNGDVNKDAAWVYRNPKEAAAEITNHVAFWKGVEVKA